MGRVAAILVMGLVVGCGPRDSSRVDAGAQPRHGTIRVELNMYNPGTVPLGIGAPNKVALELADEWVQGYPGATVKYQRIVSPGQGEGEWLKTQLIGGIAPEIVSQNAEIAWQDTEKGWYVPLDEYLDRPNPYVAGNPRWIDCFANQDLVQSKRAPNGKLYCVSIDIVETGLYYNKTLLRELGITRLPETWAEMLATLSAIDAAGVTPMATDMNLGSDWGQDIIFEMLYHDILPDMDLVPSRPDAEGYLGHYLESREAGFLFTKGFFTKRDPRWRELNRMLYEWRRYWPAELKNTDPTRLFLTQRVAFYWSGSWFIRRITTDPYVDFEWGVMYIPTITQATSPYGSGTPATVIGGAAVQLHVTNSALLNNNVEACIDYLMFLSSPQAMERLAEESLLFIPNIVGVRMDPRLEPFQEIFQRRYCAIKWLESLDGEYKKYWRRMLDYYLNDGVDLDGYLDMLETNFAGWVETHRHKGAWDFESMEPVWAQRAEALLKELDP
jgi:raffinose/stachyose/melibiose transport system substrate-binding protein